MSQNAISVTVSEGVKVVDHCVMYSCSMTHDKPINIHKYVVSLCEITFI